MIYRPASGQQEPLPISEPVRHLTYYEDFYLGRNQLICLTYSPSLLHLPNNRNDSYSQPPYEVQVKATYYTSYTCLVISYNISAITSPTTQSDSTVQALTVRRVPCTVFPNNCRGWLGKTVSRSTFRSLVIGERHPTNASPLQSSRVHIWRVV